MQNRCKRKSYSQKLQPATVAKISTRTTNKIEPLTNKPDHQHLYYLYLPGTIMFKQSACHTTQTWAGFYTSSLWWEHADWTTAWCLRGGCSHVMRWTLDVRKLDENNAFTVAHKSFITMNINMYDMGAVKKWNQDMKMWLVAVLVINPNWSMSAYGTWGKIKPQSTPKDLFLFVILGFCMCNV